MPDLLDYFSSYLHQEVGDKRRVRNGSAASSRWRDAPSEAVAVPRLQLAEKYIAF